MSNILRVCTTQSAALKYLHTLRKRERPLVKNQAVTGSTVPQVNLWCASEGEDGDEGGYRYVTPGCEHFVVWIEEHELVK